MQLASSLTCAWGQDSLKLLSGIPALPEVLNIPWAMANGLAKAVGLAQAQAVGLAQANGLVHLSLWFFLFDRDCALSRLPDRARPTAPHHAPGRLATGPKSQSWAVELRVTLVLGP